MIVDDKWLKARADEIRKVDWIDPALYQKYNVKRGLTYLPPLPSYI